MATIMEDYVSFEIAKLLKEKGFNELGDYYYTKNGDFTDCLTIGYSDLGKVICKNHTLFPYKAPTLQMAMKWLREVHNLFIQVRIIPHTTATMEQKYYFFTVYKNRRTLEFRKDSSIDHYATYEHACEAALKYCLENLI